LKNEFPLVAKMIVTWLRITYIWRKKVLKLQLESSEWFFFSICVCRYQAFSIFFTISFPISNPHACFTKALLELFRLVPHDLETVYFESRIKAFMNYRDVTLPKFQDKSVLANLICFI